MKETDVSYIAGVVDSIGRLRVKYSKDERYDTGYEVKSRIDIHRSGSQEVVLGMIDEYASEVGVMPEITERERSTQFSVSGPEDIQRFLEPLEPWLIQKHKQLDIFLGEILPAIEEGKHLEKGGLLEIAESVDEMYELDPSVKNRQHTAENLKEELAE